MASPSRRIEAGDHENNARREHWSEEEGHGDRRAYRGERNRLQGEASAYGCGRDLTFHEDYARHGDYLGRRPDDASSASRFDEEYFIDEQEAFGTGGLGDDGDRSERAGIHFETLAGPSRSVPARQRLGMSRDADAPGLGERFPDHGRAFWQRIRDVLGSWFGDAAATARGREFEASTDEPACYRGFGPKGFNRSDERIRLEVCERLSDDSYIDATGMKVEVCNALVVLCGTVETEFQRNRAQRCAAGVAGICGVRNDLVLGAGSVQRGAI